MPRNQRKRPLALRAVQRQHREAGREARRFALPVGNQRRRQHCQRGPVEAAGFLLGQQMGKRLRGLAESHVIGEDAGQRLLAQVLQPRQTLALIGAQLKREAGRRMRRLDTPRSAESPRELGDRSGVAELPMLRVEQIVQPGGVQAVDAQRRVAVAVEQVDQRLRERLEAPRGDADCGSVRRRQLHRLAVLDAAQLGQIQPARVAPEQLGEQRRQRQPLAIDVDADIEQKPVRRRRLNVRVPRLDLVNAMPEAGRNLDHPTGLDQFRYDTKQKIRPRLFRIQRVQSGGKRAH